MFVRGVKLLSSRSRSLGFNVRTKTTSAPFKTAKDGLDHARSNPNPSLPVNFEDIVRAHHRIRSGIPRTDCKFSSALSEICGCNVYLKCDLHLRTGSFKERGARNSLMALTPEAKKHGVISASAGNHAQAMAYHGGELGVPVTVVMPKNAPLTKIKNCRTLGADVILHGEHILEAREYAYSEHPTLKYINGYNDVEIVAGAGTMGVEILEQVPDTDVIVCPVGGGGLIAGLSLAIKTLKGDQCQVIGVEPENCASFKAALIAGKPVDGYKGPTLADGLSVPVVGDISYEIAKHHVDDTVTVDEINIAISLLRLLEVEKIVAEGGGGAGLAAILPGGPLYGKFKGKNVVVPLCGGNIDVTTMARVIDRGLAADQRLIRFGATVSDRPGGIAMLSAIIADLGVSIKDIYHERAWTGALDKVLVHCVVETTGSAHTATLFEVLEKDYEIHKDTVGGDGIYTVSNEIKKK
jgi:threonine dehydratase